MKNVFLKYIVVTVLLGIFTIGTIASFGIRRLKNDIEIQKGDREGNNKTENRNFENEDQELIYMNREILPESFRPLMLEIKYYVRDAFFIVSHYLTVLTPPPDRELIYS